MQICCAYGQRLAKLHPGGGEMRNTGKSEDEVIAAQARALRAITYHIQGSGMTICLENLPRSATSAEELRKIIDASDCAQLGICLDTGHLNISGGDQTQFIQSAGADLKALHIQDNEGKIDQHLMPFGRGTVPWDEVMTALDEIGCEALFNFEIPGENRCPLPARRAKLDYLRQIAEQMLAQHS